MWAAGPTPVPLGCPRSSEPSPCVASFFVLSRAALPTVGTVPNAGSQDKALISHVEMHTIGLLEDQVPDQWLVDISLRICPACSRLISTRTRRCCPRCYPSLNNPVSHVMERPLHPDTQPDEVPSTQVSLRIHIPKGAEEAWAPGSLVSSHFTKRHKSPPPTSPETRVPTRTRRQTSKACSALDDPLPLRKHYFSTVHKRKTYLKIDF